MSPAPARTSRDAILSAARAILEEDGLDAVVMSRVADRVGVRGPSLYKHVTDRAALIRAVGEAVTADLARHLSLAVSTGDPRADLTATAHAYRAFVSANPNGYGLLFAHLSPDLQPDPDAIAELARPIVEAMSAIVGAGRRSAGRPHVRGMGPRVRQHGTRRGIPARRRPRRGVRQRRRDDPRRDQRAGDPSNRLTTNSVNRTPTTSTSAPKSRGRADCTMRLPQAAGPASRAGRGQHSPHRGRSHVNHAGRPRRTARRSSSSRRSGPP